jgi:lipid II:glycine glycyltransferase (peptidoglycan interpeptide bridge formation enzyme)
MLSWLVGDRTAYYHLGCDGREGYAVKASFALFATALDQLEARGVQFASLGGGVGSTSERAGLARFRNGWANGRRTAWF